MLAPHASLMADPNSPLSRRYGRHCRRCRQCRADLLRHCRCYRQGRQYRRAQTLQILQKRSVSVARVLSECWSLLPRALMSVPGCPRMPVIPNGRIHGTQVSKYACDPRSHGLRYPNSGQLAVVRDPVSFDILQFFNGVEFSFFLCHVSRCPAVCLVRVLRRSLWCRVPVDIPTFSVESERSWKKLISFKVATALVILLQI